MSTQATLSSPTSDGFRDTKKFDVNMSLARAFTRRTKRPEISLPSRAASTRNKPINRKQISAPLELLSTTNVLAYNAPDIRTLSPLSISQGNESSSASSVKSLDDTDSLPGLSSCSSVTTPDHSDIESSPSPVEPNHLSCYFQKPARSGLSVGPDRSSNASSDSEAPAIPQRAPSHTRRSHQAMARTRSLRKSPPPNTISTVTNVARTSLDMFSSKIDADHPFGAELEQVNELAEEYAVRDAFAIDEDEQLLLAKDLKKFRAEDYAMEIEGLLTGVFEDSSVPMNALWI